MHSPAVACCTKPGNAGQRTQPLSLEVQAGLQASTTTTTLRTKAQVGLLHAFLQPASSPDAVEENRGRFWGLGSNGFLDCLGKFQVPGGERNLLGKNSENRGGWLDQEPGHFFSSVPGKVGAGGTTPLTPPGCQTLSVSNTRFCLFTLYCEKAGLHAARVWCCAWVREGLVESLWLS